MNPSARRLGPQALAAAFVIAFAAPAQPQTPVAPGKPGAKGRPATPAKAPAGPAETRFRLVLNGSLAPSGQSYNDVRTPVAYAEPSTIRTAYESGTGFGFGAAIQASVYRGLGVLVGYSLVSRDTTGSVDVSRPHPLYLNRPRTASAELASYGYSESAADLDLAYARRAGKLDWAVFAGVTLFQVEADLLSAPTFDERYPYDTLAIVATPAAAAEGDATGFNVGGRLDFLIGRSLGLGLQLRYSTASVGLSAGADASDVTLDVGGFSVGAGVRFYF
ncbi:MAG TPA: hypothetical protein VIJ10_07030 [Vicinamibacteria bacterium]|jgi:hypothetical protein